MCVKHRQTPPTLGLLDPQRSFGGGVRGWIRREASVSDRNPKRPPEAEIQQAMSGVLSDVFTHMRMLRAIKRYAQEVAGRK